MIKLDSLLQGLPKINLGEQKSQRWCYGQRIIYEKDYSNGFYRTYNHLNHFMGITCKYEDDGVPLIKAQVMLYQLSNMQA